MAFDVCLVGHVTQDQIEIAGAPVRRMAGGAAYYGGMAACVLGLSTAVLTKMAPADQPSLLRALKGQGVIVEVLSSLRTTVFINRYPEASQGPRIQQVPSVAEAFQPADLRIEAGHYLLGPLTRDEISQDCVAAWATQNRRLVMDVQGLLREIIGERVVLKALPGACELLKHLEVVKADVEEARILTGMASPEAAARWLLSAGVGEVLVTAGSRGSLVMTAAGRFPIPAFHPPAAVDTTGCGDTYLAAYLFRRREGGSVAASARFAAAAASLKIASAGAFQGTEGDVYRFAAEAETIPDPLFF